MTLILLLLSFSVEIPVPLSVYLLNPTSGYFLGDWRIGPSYSPLYEVANIWGIKKPLFDDLSLFSTNGIHFERTGFDITLEPSFFSGDTPITLLYSERGSSDLTHLGMYFATPFTKGKNISIAMDTRYLSPEYFPIRRKVTSISISGRGNLIGGPLRVFFTSDSREGILEGKERYYFTLLGWGRDTNLVFSYTGRDRPGLPIGEKYSLRVKIGHGSSSFLAQGQLDYSNSEFIPRGELGFRGEKRLMGDTIDAHLGAKYDGDWGIGPNIGLSIYGKTFTLQMSFDNIALPYSWRTGNATWEERKELIFDLRTVQFFDIHLRARRSKDPYFLKEGKPTQCLGNFTLLEIMPMIKMKLGLFEISIEGRFGRIDPEIIEYRRSNLRTIVGFRKYIESLDIALHLKTMIDYYGASIQSSRYLTGHVKMGLTLFDSAEVEFSIFNISDKLPESWPLNYRGRTLQFGMSLLLFD